MERQGTRILQMPVYERVDLVMNALARRSDAQTWCGFELYIFICGEAAAH